MILRIVRGGLPADRLAGLAEGFATRFAPGARSTPGLVRFHLGVRPRGGRIDLAAITFWTSVEAAMVAFQGDLDTPRTLAGLPAEATFTDVAYYEVDESLLRRTSGEPALIRVAIGRVAQGEDVPLQQELRARIGSLPEDVAEAYVARRIVGTDVEVAFVSTWERVPAGRSLDEPIWPDIADRYDAMVVDTFVPMTSTPERPSG